MQIQLGISPINWSNDDDPNLGADISFEQCIREMAEAGFCGTEIGSKFPKDPQILTQQLQAHGLEITSAWFSSFFTEADRYDETLSHFLDHLSLVRALGAKFINVCECGHAIQQTAAPVLGAGKPRFSSEQWQLLIRGLHQIGRIAYDFNMKLMYHYHAGTGVFTYDEIKFLMQHTSPHLVHLLLDTGHAAFADIDPIKLITEFGHRIGYVHLKDIRPFILQQTQLQQWNFMDAVRAGVFTVPGDGSIPFKAILQALKEHHYQGWLLIEAEQDPGKAHPLTYAKKAFHYLQEITT